MLFSQPCCVVSHAVSSTSFVVFLHSQHTVSFPAHSVSGISLCSGFFLPSGVIALPFGIGLICPHFWHSFCGTFFQHLLFSSDVDITSVMQLISTNHHHLHVRGQVGHGNEELVPAVEVAEGGSRAGHGPLTCFLTRLTCYASPPNVLCSPRNVRCFPWAFHPQCCGMLCAARPHPL